MTSKPVALITGACSGMGEGFALHLASKGWNIAMVDINPKQELINKLGEDAIFQKADVSDYDGQAKAFQAAWDKYGRLDLFIANAGIFDRSSLFIFDHRDSDTIPPKPNLLCTDVNVKGVYYGTQLAVHFMRKNKTPGGKIIVMASAASLYGHEVFVEYSGTKAAVYQFVRSIARILKAKENIRINCIRPGFVPTALAPHGMIAAAGEKNLTPLSTIVTALDHIVEDESLVGKALECSIEKIIETPEPEFLNGEASKAACFFYEPAFVALHGEPSGHPNAVS